MFQDETLLIWFAGKEEKQLKLSHVSRIIPGQRTVCSTITLKLCIFLYIISSYLPPKVFGPLPLTFFINLLQSNCRANIFNITVV